MATAADLIEAINAGDADRVEAILADGSRPWWRRGTRTGVSALMLARYRFDRAVTDVLLAADPELDVFEAATLGYVDRLRERLDADPGAASAFSTGRLHGAPFRGVLRQGGGGEDAAGAGASVDVVHAQPVREPAAPRRGGRAQRGGLPGPARRRVPTSNATQHGGFTPLHEAAQHGDVEMAELFLSAGADPPAPRRGWHARRPRRGGRASRRRQAAAAGHDRTATGTFGAGRIGRTSESQRAPPAPTIGPQGDEREGTGRSAALEVALAVPRVDDRVVRLLLDPRGVEVVVDDVLAEDLDRGLGPFQLPDRLVQGARHPRMARWRGSRCP